MPHRAPDGVELVSPFFHPEPWVLAGYAACLLLNLAFSLAECHLWRLRHRGAAPALPSVDEWPHVTIQLPVYNERYVIRALIAAVAAIDYPRELLDIQILDDSTDETVAIASSLAAQLRARGLQIAHVQRAERTGYKAGALAHGLALARGEMLAIFDADFLPAPDFLRHTVPFFADPRVGGVQVRWSYLNRDASRLTWVQSFMLGLHFCFEQGVRCRNGLFLNFNGTAGVLRKAAIIDAGGWSADTLTEDIDLSYRAQLRGWTLIYRDDYTCASELPADMTALRTQQYRWIKGGAQNARRHAGTVLRSGLPGRVRFHALLHLMAGSIYLPILGAVLLSVPLAALKNTWVGPDYADFGMLFLASLLPLFLVFRETQQPVPRGLGANLRFVGAMLLFLAFTIGLSVHNGAAALSGWLDRRSEFVRTAKFGASDWTTTAYAMRQVDRRVAMEVVVLAVLVAGLFIGWQREEFALFPIQLMAASGLLWVIGLSLVHPFRAWRNRAVPVPASVRPEPATREVVS